MRSFAFSSAPKQVRATPPDWVATVLGGLIIALAVLIANLNTFRLPFVFDDRASVLDNPTIRHLWPLWDALAPPRGTGITVAGRPVLNFSFAINYAISGLDGWSYRALNLVIHAFAGLTLFGLVRRTLTWPTLAARFGKHARPLALMIAVLWTLHPIQTESVTYLVQRAESLMGLFYLQTMYCYVRSIDARRPAIWSGLAIAACGFGMGTKEVMVSAPLLVLLYDRTFVAGSLGAAWRRRKLLYVGLAGTWLVLAFDLVDSTTRGGTVGFGPGVSSWAYALTQIRAIVLYLKLAFWPAPLVIDYGSDRVGSAAEVWPQSILLVLLLAGVATATWRRWPTGFIGSWFFLILAPSSSLVPVAVQTIAEHRMYLPLAAVITLGVVGSYDFAGRIMLGVFLSLAGCVGWLTLSRNEVYRSELVLWRDTVAKKPGNARARTNFGLALGESGRLPEAVGQYEEAIRIDPAIPIAQLNLCGALVRLGRPAEGLPHGEAAVRLDPSNSNAQVNLGLALIALGRAGEAVPPLTAARQLEPGSADILGDLGAAFVQLRRGAEAIGFYESALRLDPDRAQTWCDLALADLLQGDRLAARHAGEHALGLQPDFPQALFVLGNLDAEDENYVAAITRYRRALALAPDYLSARNNLANALLVSGQIDEAMALYQQILRARPDDLSARENLARAVELQQSMHPAQPVTRGGH